LTVIVLIFFTLPKKFENNLGKIGAIIEISKSSFVRKYLNTVAWLTPAAFAISNVEVPLYPFLPNNIIAASNVFFLPGGISPSAIKSKDDFNMFSTIFFSSRLLLTLLLYTFL